MLTADLLRVKDDEKSIEPRYLKLESPRSLKKHLGRAEGLIELFRGFENHRRGELNEAIADFTGDDTGYQITRGLTKLLEDRSTFETRCPFPPTDVRAILFELSAANHPIVADPDAVHKLDRHKILELTAQRLNARWTAENPEEKPIDLTVEDIEEAFYGDLNENQRLTHFKDIEAEALLHRYNLALAQAVLYRATELNIYLRESSAARYRQLFRYLKFYQLMYRVRRTSPGSWHLTIDGPLSLLKNTNKYGLKMAMFLPALIHCSDWTMDAELRWGPDRSHRTFHLSSLSGLRSHYPSKGVYVTEEQKAFEVGFRKIKKNPWKLKRSHQIINLGGRDVLAPDLLFTHESTGKEVHMEIIGHWRKGWLARKAEILAEHGPEDLILAYSDRLQTDREKIAPDSGITFFPFKGVIVAKKVLKLLEESFS